MSRELKFRALYKYVATGEREWQFATVGCMKQVHGWLQITEWEQYTGLHDKHGREIYEGDIVEQHVFVPWSDDPKYRPRVDRWVAEFDIQTFDNNYACLGWSVPPDQNPEWWIVGNVHETPEILEDNDD